MTDDPIGAALDAAFLAYAGPLVAELNDATLSGRRPVASEALQRRCTAAAVVGFLRAMPSIIDISESDCAWLSGMTWPQLAERVERAAKEAPNA